MRKKYYIEDTESKKTRVTEREYYKWLNSLAVEEVKELEIKHWSHLVILLFLLPALIIALGLVFLRIQPFFEISNEMIDYITYGAIIGFSLVNLFVAITSSFNYEDRNSKQTKKVIKKFLKTHDVVRYSPFPNVEPKILNSSLL